MSSRMEGFYFQTNLRMKMVGRGRRRMNDPLLPPYLTNSDQFFRQRGQPRKPFYKFLSAPYIGKKVNFHHRNVTRLVQGRLSLVKRSLVEDEDGHIWYTWDLEAQQCRSMEEDTSTYQDDDEEMAAADSGVGTSYSGE